MQQITFHIDEKLHGRYKKLSKTIQSLGIDIGKTVPHFLIDKLESEEKKHFSNLKRYIGKKCE